MQPHLKVAQIMGLPDSGRALGWEILGRKKHIVLRWTCLPGEYPLARFLSSPTGLTLERRHGLSPPRGDFHSLCYLLFYIDVRLKLQ